MHEKGLSGCEQRLMPLGKNDREEASEKVARLDREGEW
jgi:hypothetical protein